MNKHLMLIFEDLGNFPRPIIEYTNSRGTILGLYSAGPGEMIYLYITGERATKINYWSKYGHLATAKRVARELALNTGMERKI